MADVLDPVGPPVLKASAGLLTNCLVSSPNETESGNNSSFLEIVSP